MFLAIILFDILYFNSLKLYLSYWYYAFSYCLELKMNIMAR